MMIWCFFVGVRVGLGLPEIENFLKNSRIEVKSRKFCVKTMANIEEREKWKFFCVWCEGYLGLKTEKFLKNTRKSLFLLKFFLVWLPYGVI